MSDTPTAAEMLRRAMVDFRYAVADVMSAAPSPAEARPVFVLEASTLRARAAAGDRMAAAELARRDARATLHRAAELAALDPHGPLDAAGLPPHLSAGTSTPSPAPSPPPAPKPAPLREVPKPPEADDEADRLAARVREWRTAAGLSQSQAAARLGVTRSAWGNYERGYPPIAEVRARLEALLSGAE